MPSSAVSAQIGKCLLNNLLFGESKRADDFLIHTRVFLTQTTRNTTVLLAVTISLLRGKQNGKMGFVVYSGPGSSDLIVKMCIF